MRDADEAYAEAERLIAEAKATGATELRLDRAETRDLEVLPPQISELAQVKVLSLNNTQVSDIQALSGLSQLERLRLRYTRIDDLSAISSLTSLLRLSLEGIPAFDLRPLLPLKNLLKAPVGSGLTFENCGATKIDSRIKKISGLEDASERTQKLFDYLADIPQVECPFLHVVDVLHPDQAACATFVVVWAPDAGTERDFWSRQLG